MQSRDAYTGQLLLGESGDRINLLTTGYLPSQYVFGEGQCPQGSKGCAHLRKTRDKVIGMQRKNMEVVIEAPAFPQCSDCGKAVPSGIKAARSSLRAQGCRSGLEVMMDETTQLIWSVRPYFGKV